MGLEAQEEDFARETGKARDHKNTGLLRNRRETLQDLQPRASQQ